MLKAFSYAATAIKGAEFFVHVMEREVRNTDVMKDFAGNVKSGGESVSLHSKRLLFKTT